MAKLIILALAFAAVVAFATATTIVTTTIDDEYPVAEQMQCRQKLQGQNLNPCRMFLQQSHLPMKGRQQHHQQQQQQQPFLNQCCQQLENVGEQCQCEAVKQVFRDAQKQQQQQQQWQQFVPFFGSQQTQQLKQKAQGLPNLCNLQSKQCRIGSISTTVTEKSNLFDLPFDIPFFKPPFSFSPQCSESDIRRPVNKCQRHVAQQIRSPIMRMTQEQEQKQEQSQELQQCCDELHYMKKGCECQAIKEVAKRVMQQQQFGGQFGGQQMKSVRRIVRDLPNQCWLDLEQCTI